MEKQEQEERKHIEALDRKIERLQEKVIKKHKEYSVLAEELSTLLDERHPERKIERAKQALYDAYVESERSLDEIIDLIRNADEWIQAGFSCKISGSSQITVSRGKGSTSQLLPFFQLQHNGLYHTDIPVTGFSESGQPP